MTRLFPAPKVGTVFHTVEDLKAWGIDYLIACLDNSEILRCHKGWSVSGLGLQYGKYLPYTVVGIPDGFTAMESAPAVEPVSFQDLMDAIDTYNHGWVPDGWDEYEDRIHDVLKHVHTLVFNVPPERHPPKDKQLPKEGE
jgi:hypothetical protein